MVLRQDGEHRRKHDAIKGYIDIPVEEYEDAYYFITEPADFRAKITDESFDHEFGTEVLYGKELEMDLENIIVRMDVSGMKIEDVLDLIEWMGAEEDKVYGEEVQDGKHEDDTTRLEFDLKVKFNILGAKDRKYLLFGPEVDVV